MRAISARLGIELAELTDWSCCGASSAHQTGHWLAHALAGRNLALAEKVGLDLAIACPACYLRLRTTQKEMKDNPKQRDELAELIGTPYEAKNNIRHLLPIIYHDVGVTKLKNSVAKPLAGLKLVCYYGCYLVRPPEVVAFDDPENPRMMDLLLDATGADVRDWSGKVDCCGGSLSMSKRHIARRLVAEITQWARNAGAEAIVTACPLCHSNLEARQSDKLPVFYFTELIGLALGIAGVRQWLRKHLISPLRLLAAHGL